MIPKIRGEKFSSGFLHSEFFWGGVSHYAATPLIVALSPGHSDITRFCPRSPIATGIHLDRAEKKLMNSTNNLRGGHCFVSSRTRRITGGRITTFKLGPPVFDGGIRWSIFP